MSEKCLIVGLGQIGMGYDLNLDPEKALYSHARAFSLHPAFQLLGAVDPCGIQRSLFESNYNRPAYSDIETALKKDSPNIVVISAPTIAHSALLSEILTHARPKVILCEKPLAYEICEARKMVEVCEEEGIELYVNYMRRTDPGAIAVKNLIDSKKIAEPIKGVVWYSKGFLHNGSHFFNLLEFWLGSFVEATLIDKGRLFGEHDVEPDVRVEFEHGSMVFLAAWEEAFSHYTIELLSPNGRLMYEQGGEYVTWQDTDSDPNFVGYRTLRKDPEVIPNEMNRYQWCVVNQVADAIGKKENSLCTGWQALDTIEAMHHIINLR